MNVNSVLGIESEIKKNPSNEFFSRNHIYTYPSTFDHFENHEQLIADGTIVELIPYKTPGMKTGDSWASRERVGSFLVKANSMTELQERIRKAVTKLKVIDNKGNDVFNRSIFSIDGIQ